MSSLQESFPTTIFSTPQLKSIQLEDRVLLNNSQVKKKEVEEHRKPLHQNPLFRNLEEPSGSYMSISWWYTKLTPPGYKWEPKSKAGNVKSKVSVPPGTASRTTNILETKTVRRSNLSNTPLSSYSFAARRDNLVHLRLWVLKAYDGKSQASVNFHWEISGNDLLTATSSQEWLWHHHLSYLNFDTINLLSKNDIVNGLPKLKFIKDHLCSSCDLGKAKQKSFKTKTTPRSKGHLQLLHVDLCGPMRVESINGKKYVLVIVDDYSRYTWTHLLRFKDETSKVLIDFLRLIQRGL
ncbi:retrovirus-related pol polyprotein from transposon TNT 1-94 [Tanacetum coccineum]|uniref:Retrovirus-related pol polyprotein from transposon TNT 1-94 n=1 Tax=Tanacetum coccineum TaxID=301880 RepID=A0ABQ5FN73_9ASTR